jgi:hypothetical protein
MPIPDPRLEFGAAEAAKLMFEQKEIFDFLLEL